MDCYSWTKYLNYWGDIIRNKVQEGWEEVWLQNGQNLYEIRDKRCGWWYVSETGESAVQRVENNILVMRQKKLLTAGSWEGESELQYMQEAVCCWWKRLWSVIQNCHKQPEATRWPTENCPEGHGLLYHKPYYHDFGYWRQKGKICNPWCKVHLIDFQWVWACLALCRVLL